MKKIKVDLIKDYVERNIENFHNSRIKALSKLNLKRVLQKKNPYLYKAKYLLTAQDIVKSITNAFISSQEEAIFGNWLEGLAIFVNEQVYKGRKSGISGIDLEFDLNSIRYIVTIKSGPNWGNSGQINKMKSDFTTAKRILRTSNSNLNIVAVNGCCYGRENVADRGEYFKYCGQKFWEFISGDSELYVKLIEPLAFKAKERNTEFVERYAKILNLFTIEFSSTFCKQDGAIDWDKLVVYNSAIQRIKTETKKKRK